MTQTLNILMLAAENDAIGLKEGGVADVLKGITPSLAELHDPDCRITVVNPAHGLLGTMSDVTLIDTYEFPFAGQRETVSLYVVKAKTPHPKVRHFVLDSPRFVVRNPASGACEIYSHDPSEGPFERDATKYACFCAAVAEGHRLGLFGEVNCIHLHDWHAALLLVLREFDPEFATLKRLRVAYTIHNLVLQGVRPIKDHPSSLMEWYPQLRLVPTQLARICDPDNRDCINPMAVGIRISDAVNVVSPTYKLEVLQPSYPRRNDASADRIRGEGLELDLQAADQEGRLHGILNGCEYDDKPILVPDLATWRQLLTLAEEAATKWNSNHSRSAHFLALERVGRLRMLANRPATLVTAVTRAAEQKVRLMGLPKANPALSQILRELPSDAVFILLGSGDCEPQLEALSVNHENFLFLAGFSNDVAAALYANGDVFLMPSSFEPCGISQMLAMRAGQPCVVHGVGGLSDTVEDGVTGFSFNGETADEQAAGFVRTVRRATEMMRTEPARYAAMRRAAAAARFRWTDSARLYAERLYC